MSLTSQLIVFSKVKARQNLVVYDKRQVFVNVFQLYKEMQNNFAHLANNDFSQFFLIFQMRSAT